MNICKHQFNNNKETTKNVYMLIHIARGIQIGNSYMRKYSIFRSSECKPKLGDKWYELQSQNQDGE